MTPGARRRSGALVGAAAAMVVATLAACADTDVHTTSAVTVDGPSPTAPPDPDEPTDPDPSSTATTEPAVPDTPAEPTPETSPEPDPGPAGGEPPTSDPVGENDVASAGDELFPDIGNGDVDVEHYTVKITYDPAEQQVDGEVVADVTALVPVDQVVLDSVGLDIEDVAVDGAPVSFTTTEDELVIDHPLDGGESASVAVTYRGAPAQQAGAFGLEAGWFATPTGSYVLNEPDALRTWMPADDHPADKATWRFELTVPEGLTGVANGALVDQQTANGQTTWTWEQTDPMSTYLVQLLTGEYEVLDGGTAGTVATFPITNVALTQDVERMQPYFDLTDDMVAFFEPWFGPYPLDRYGLAMTESYSGLAMETQGRSLFSRLDFPGGEPGYVEHLLLSHELAHQWFGNAVSPGDWRDLWLNESFATYGEWMWMDHAGQAPLERQAEESLMVRGTISADATGEPSVDNLFGFERYGGGAVVLHALRRTIGDDAFFAVLQQWVTENDGASRTTVDFIALAEEVSGHDLTTFFDDWLYARDVPAEYPD